MIWIIVGCAFTSGAIIGWVARDKYDRFCAGIDNSDWVGS